MKARKLPSLNALRAFEASARLRSFTQAAQELCVTQGAVSHQVKALEESIGLPLFERLANQLRLTPAGASYMKVVADAFDRIEIGTRHLHEQRTRKRLAVSTSPNFAAKWLVPRLGSFSAQHPDLEMRVEQREQRANFIRADIDIAIRYGAGMWPGLAKHQLAQEFLLPVAAPALAPAPASALSEADSVAGILRHPLLHAAERAPWENWLARYGSSSDVRAAEHGVLFSHDSAAIDAAVAGQGVALARASLAVEDIRQGRLIVLARQTLPLAEHYWMLHPQDSELDENSLAFADWLQQSFTADHQFWAGFKLQN
jgi:LysR family glycine cleavage system transcriptional activator